MTQAVDTFSLFIEGLFSASHLILSVSSLNKPSSWVPYLHLIFYFDVCCLQHYVLCLWIDCMPLIVCVIGKVIDVQCMEMKQHWLKTNVEADISDLIHFRLVFIQYRNGDDACNIVEESSSILCLI